MYPENKWECLIDNVTMMLVDSQRCDTIINHGCLGGTNYTAFMYSTNSREKQEFYLSEKI